MNWNIIWRARASKHYLFILNFKKQPGSRIILFLEMDKINCWLALTLELEDWIYQNWSELSTMIFPKAQLTISNAQGGQEEQYFCIYLG